MREFKPFQGFVGGFEGRLPSGLLEASRLLLLKQVHGDRIHLLKSEEARQGLHLQEGDALLSLVPGVGIAVKTADCVPILVAHPTGIVGAVHAGWRGTRARILEKVLRKIRGDLGAELAEIRIAIGPAICAACYEVGEEVAREFEPRYRVDKGKGKFLLDLKRANSEQARDLGIPEERIEILGDCTLCQPETYHSYRYESQKGAGKEGRNYSWIRFD